MIKLLRNCLVLNLLLGNIASAQAAEPHTDPWTGKYPMSFFNRMRTANTVGHNKLSIAVKLLSAEADEIYSNGTYCDLPDGSRNDVLKTVTTFKYGWARDHHLAVGIPYLWVDSEGSSSVVESDGLANIFVFEKWRCLSESRQRPAMAFDIWYYLPTGDQARKRGTDQSSIKLSMEMSKAWKHVNLHLMPGFSWNVDGGCDIGTLDLGILCPVHRRLLLGGEYNYTNKEDKHKGECQDLVPGLIWKPFKGASVKLGAVVNLESDMKYRDDVGFVAKMFYKLSF